MYMYIYIHIDRHVVVRVVRIASNRHAARRVPFAGKKKEKEKIADASRSGQQ